MTIFKSIIVTVQTQPITNPEITGNVLILKAFSGCKTLLNKSSKPSKGI